jgi:hypothetical protein
MSSQSTLALYVMTQAALEIADPGKGLRLVG